MKKFLENLSFGIDFKLWIPPLTYEINTHNMESEAKINSFFLTNLFETNKIQSRNIDYIFSAMKTANPNYG